MSTIEIEGNINVKSASETENCESRMTIEGNLLNITILSFLKFRESRYLP